MEIRTDDSRTASAVHMAATESGCTVKEEIAGWLVWRTWTMKVSGSPSALRSMKSRLTAIQEEMSWWDAIR